MMPEGEKLPVTVFHLSGSLEITDAMLIFLPSMMRLRVEDE